MRSGLLGGGLGYLAGPGAATACPRWRDRCHSHCHVAHKTFSRGSAATVWRSLREQVTVVRGVRADDGQNRLVLWHEPVGKLERVFDFSHSTSRQRDRRIASAASLIDTLTARLTAARRKVFPASIELYVEMGLVRRAAYQLGASMVPIAALPIVSAWVQQSLGVLSEGPTKDERDHDGHIIVLEIEDFYSTRIIDWRWETPQCLSVYGPVRPSRSQRKWRETGRPDGSRRRTRCARPEQTLPDRRCRSFQGMSPRRKKQLMARFSSRNLEIGRGGAWVGRAGEAHCGAEADTIAVEVVNEGDEFAVHSRLSTRSTARKIWNAASASSTEPKPAVFGGIAVPPSLTRRSSGRAICCR